MREFVKTFDNLKSVITSGYTKSKVKGMYVKDGSPPVYKTKDGYGIIKSKLIKDIQPEDWNIVVAPVRSQIPETEEDKLKREITEIIEDSEETDWHYNGEDEYPVTTHDARLAASRIIQFLKDKGILI